MKDMLDIGPDKTMRKCHSFRGKLIRDFISEPGFGPVTCNAI